MFYMISYILYTGKKNIKKQKQFLF